MSYLVFDPHKRTTDMADATQIEHFTELAALARALMDEVIAKRKLAKKKHPNTGKDDFFSCPVKHRKTGEVRFFNFDPQYKGRLDHAEACFKGAWFLANDEDEAQEYAKQAAAKMDAALETVRLQEAVNKTAAVDSMAYRNAVKTINAANGVAAKDLNAVEVMKKENEDLKAELKKLQAASATGQQKPKQ